MSLGYGRSVDWTDDNVAELRRLFGDGLSAGQIAREMGLNSRNPIVGKLDRLGLKRGLRRAVNPTPRPPKPPRVARRAPFAPKLAAVAPPPKPAPACAAEPAGRYRCDLFGLTRRSCRWPVTDGSPFMFCGEPEADFPAVPYCRFHTRRAHDRSRDYGQEAA